MHQYSMAKILVFTYKQSQMVLIEAQTNLGEAYFNFKCFKQAQEHLALAAHKNGKLFMQDKESRLLQVRIAIILGKCYLETG